MGDNGVIWVLFCKITNNCNLRVGFVFEKCYQLNKNNFCYNYNDNNYYYYTVTTVITKAQMIMTTNQWKNAFENIKIRDNLS